MRVVLVVQAEVRVAIGALPVGHHLQRARAGAWLGFDLEIQSFLTNYIGIVEFFLI